MTEPLGWTTLAVLDQDLTVLAGYDPDDVEGSSTIKWDPEASNCYPEESGEGSFVLVMPWPEELPDGAGDPATAVEGRLVRFWKSDGEGNLEVRFTGLIEVVDVLLVGEEPQQRQWKCSGRSWIAELEWELIEPPLGALVEPAPSVVRFDPSHPAFDISEWDPPYVYGPVSTFDAPRKQPPEGHIDNDAAWVDPEEHVEGSVAPGPRWVVRDFTIIEDFDGSDAGITWSVDNKGELCLNGGLWQEGFEPPGVTWQKTLVTGARFTQGDHRLAVRYENLDPTDALNPAGVELTFWLMPVSPRWNRNDILFRTDNPVTGWKGYVGDPGFRWGHAMLTLLVGSAWEATFTETHDSASNPWPEQHLLEATVNDPKLKWLVDSRDRGYCEFRADLEERLIHAYLLGEMGETDTPATWTSDQVESIELEGRF